MMKKIFSSALAAFMLLSSAALADEAKAPLPLPSKACSPQAARLPSL